MFSLPRALIAGEGCFMESAMFCGVGCALVTPFSDGRVDFPAFEALVERQLAAGTEALIVCGTTGEPSTLTDGEALELVRCAASRAEGRAAVIAGAGANCTRTAARRASLLSDAGADALLCVTPYYNRANQEGLIRHFRAVADASRVPLILYNVPSRTAVNLLPETVTELLKHPLIRGVKEASSDIRQLAELLRLAGDGCHVYGGNDDMALPALALGASGMISVTANVVPRLYGRMVRAAMHGALAEARACFRALAPLNRVLFADVSPIPVKAALAELGLIQNELRLPLTPLARGASEALRALLANPEFAEDTGRA